MEKMTRITGHVDRAENDEVNFCPVCRGPVLRTAVWVNGRSTGADRLNCPACLGNGALHSTGEYVWRFPKKSPANP